MAFAYPKNANRGKARIFFAKQKLLQSKSESLFGPLPPYIRCQTFATEEAPMSEKVLSILDDDYQRWISSLKKRYRQSQIKAAVKVNAELISFYWALGRDIATMKPEEKWGKGFYKTLSRDLRESISDAKGFSPRNLRYMRQFYELFPSLEILQQVVAQIGEGGIFKENEIATQLVPQIVSVPWGHIVLIMNHAGQDRKKALFYVTQTVLNNWSRAMLFNFIKSDLYARHRLCPTKFFPNFKLKSFFGAVPPYIRRGPYQTKAHPY